MEIIGNRSCFFKKKSKLQIYDNWLTLELKKKIKAISYDERRFHTPVLSFYTITNGRFDGLRPTTEETRNWTEIGQVIDIGESFCSSYIFVIKLKSVKDSIKIHK